MADRAPLTGRLAAIAAALPATAAAIDARARHADLPAVVDDYVAATADERAAARASVRADRRLSHLLLRHGWRCSRTIPRAGTVALRRGVASASLEGGALDWRDSLVLLADLWVGAERAGLTPRAVFDEAAAWSSANAMPGSDESFAQVLRGFRHYAILRERRRG